MSNSLSKNYQQNYVTSIFSIQSKLYQSQEQKIYRVSQKNGKKTNNIKILIIQKSKQQKLGYQFIQHLDHQTIPKIVYFQYKKGNYYIVREQFNCKKLSESIESLQQRQIMLIYNQLSQFLKQIHQKNIIFNNINPQNIFYDKKDSLIKIANFSKIFYSNTAIDYVIIKQIQNQITFPPQLKKNNILSYKADIWALGLLILVLVKRKNILQIQQQFKVSDDNYTQVIKSIKNNNSQIIQILRCALQLDFTKRKIYIIKTSVDMNQKRMSNDLIQVLRNYNRDFINKINVSNCQLSDQIGKIIKDFSKVSDLNVSGNQISDKFIKNIQKIIPSLKQLNLSFTNISNDTIMRLTSNQTNKLIKLDISYTNITSQKLCRLNNLVKLKSLAVWFGDDYPIRYHTLVQNNFQNRRKLKCKLVITKQFLETLKKLSLNELIINSNEISIKDIYLLRYELIQLVLGCNQTSRQYKFLNLKNIKSLYLVNNFQLKYTESCQFQHIQLINCRLQQQFLQKLQQSPKLTQLHFQHCRISSANINQISKIKSLKYLNLSQNSLNKDCAQIIASNLKSLQYLNLSNYLIIYIKILSDRKVLYLLLIR